MRQMIKGFTLIEMIISIVLMSIIGIAISYIMPYPIQAYLQTNARSELADLAGSFLIPFSREIQESLPNSPRVKADTNRVAIEFIPIIASGRYRSDAPGNADDILDFSQGDDAFNVLADINRFLPADAPGVYRLVIDNIGQYDYTDGLVNYDLPLAGMNVYSSSGYAGAGALLPLGSNVVTPQNTTVTFSSVAGPGGSSSEVRATLSAPFRFSLQSPTSRVYVINTAVSYVCDVSEGTLTKYYDYVFKDTQPMVPSNLGAQSALVLDNVRACSFRYDPGTATRSGTVTIQVTLTSQQGEEASFLQQIQVKNAA